MDAPLALLAQIRQDIEEAAGVLLGSAEGGLKELGAVRAGDAAAAGRLETHLVQILQACAFQDLVGQRLGQLNGMLAAPSSAPVDADPLLNGPALEGQGLDQAAADRLFLET